MFLGLLTAAFAQLALTVLPASAAIVPGHGRGASAPAGQITLSGLGNGQGVTGGIEPVGFNPLAGYPPAPSAIATPSDESFAGVIFSTSNTTPPQTLQTYCIDLETLTWFGLSYALGTWNAANVAHPDLVHRILVDYFPHTPGQPTAAVNDNERAAAVQAAIWFFTDRYVLNPGDPVRALTASIVAAVLAAGGLPQPTLPLTISGPTVGPAAFPSGPFTITTTAPTVTVHVTGGALFSDAAATQPVPDGSVILSTTKLWLVPFLPGAAATISVHGEGTAPLGQAFVYLPADPNNPNPVDAQKQILAMDGTVVSDASTALAPFDTGSLTVSKSITGPGAGTQGPIVITVVCTSTANPPVPITLPPFQIPAGSTGTQSKTYNLIPTPSTCVITETSNGGTSSTTVTVVTGSQNVTLPANGIPNDQVPTETIVDTFQTVVTPAPTPTGGVSGVTAPTTGATAPLSLMVAAALLAAGTALLVLGLTRRRA